MKEHYDAIRRRVLAAVEGLGDVDKAFAIDVLLASFPSRERSAVAVATALANVLYVPGREEPDLVPEHAVLMAFAEGLPHHVRDDVHVALSEVVRLAPSRSPFTGGAD